MQAGWSGGETQGDRDRGGGGQENEWKDHQTKGALPPEEIGDSQHAASFPHRTNASSLVGCSPADRDNKERSVNNTQAASAAVGVGVLNVGNTAAAGTVGQVQR